MKAGILEEMIEDTMEGLEGEGEEEEEAAQAEIDRIMFELTAGALGSAPDALKGEFFNYRTGTQLQFNFILFWNFFRNQTENDRYWQKNNFLLFAKCLKRYSFFAFAFIVCKKCYKQKIP